MIGRGARGANAGCSPLHSPTRPVEEPRGVFPLRCVLKSPPLHVAYRVGQGLHCPAGVGPDWLDAWPKIPHFPAFQQVRSVVGSEPNTFAQGAIMPGSTSLIPSLSCNELARYSKPMVKREHSCKQACGGSVWMRKPPFRPVRASSRLAQHARASRCCT